MFRTIALPTAVLLLSLAATALLAATAQAEPKLKASSYPVKYEGSGSASKLVVGSREVGCTENKTSGEFDAPEGGEQKGVSKTTFKGCKAEGISCKTPGAGAGEILIAEPVDHYTLIEPVEEESLYGLVELEVEDTVECGVLHIKTHGSVIVVLGVTEGKAIKTSESVTAEAKGSGGKQEFTKCDEPKALCEKGPFSLTGEITEGKPESAVLTIKDTAKFSAEVTPEG